MPRREDERRLNMADKHPPACTCADCVDRFLKRRTAKRGGPAGFFRRLFGRR